MVERRIIEIENYSFNRGFLSFYYIFLKFIVFCILRNFFFVKVWFICVFVCLIQLGMDFLLFVIGRVIIYICDYFIIVFNKRKVDIFFKLLCLYDYF